MITCTSQFGMGLGQLQANHSHSASDISGRKMSDADAGSRNTSFDVDSPGETVDDCCSHKSLTLIDEQDNYLLKRLAPGQPSGYYSNRFYHSLPHHYKLPSLSIHPLKEVPHLKEPTISNKYAQKLAVVTKWFRQFNDQQKNQMLVSLLGDCEQPQNHLLSVFLQDKLHAHCPPNCQDFLLWLPRVLTHKILSYLDPVSLARCLQVCRHWKSLASSESLWQRLSYQEPWKLSQAGHSKQISLVLEQGAIVSWRKLFAERYRLRRNWLRGQCHVRTFEGHTQGVSCVQFDDTRIVSGSHDKTIKVWNIRTNSPWSVMTLVGHSGTVRCLHMLGNRLVSGSTDQNLKVWDLSVQEQWSSIACKVTMIGHTNTVRCVQVLDPLILLI